MLADKKAHQRPRVGNWSVAFSSCTQVALVATDNSNTAHRVAHVFRNYELPLSHQINLGTSDSVPLWQALRATSAAPFYFRPMEISKSVCVISQLCDWSAFAGSVVYLDGGLVANNPTRVAMQEADALLSLHNQIHRPKCILSVGTGTVAWTAPATNDNVVSKLGDLAGLLLGVATATETVANDMTAMVETSGGLLKHERMNVHIGEVNLAESNERILKSLERAAEKYMAKHGDGSRIMKTFLQSCAPELLQQQRSHAEL